MSLSSGGDRGRRFAALALAVGFFLVHVPDLFDFSRYHGDERFYTDAAIGMVQSGDWLTPRYPDGRLRLEKPLLGYLVLAGSYEALGISLAASRLPFLLAGALLVFATWRAGMLLLRDADAALLAAAIVAASPDFAAMSVRSTPDILSCLFLLLGLTGFFRLLEGGAAREGAAAQAWLGAGFAVAAKGGLGLVLIGFAFGAAALRKDRAARVRRLLDPVWTPIGLLVAVSGFGVYAAAHGVAALEPSVGDQVGERLSGQASYLRQLAAYGGIAAEHLAPWLLLAVVGVVRDAGALADFGARERPVARFAGAWLVALLLIFSAGDVVRGRYLAPAYPLVALVLAGLLVAFERRGAAAGAITGVCRGGLVAAAVAGLVLAAGGAPIGNGLVVAGLLVAAVAVGGLWLSRRRSAWMAMMGLAAMAIVAQGLGAAAVRSTLARTPIEDLAACLAAPELATSRVAQVGESAHLASKLRLATGGKLTIDAFGRGRSEPNSDDYRVIVSDTSLPDRISGSGFRAEQCGETWSDRWTPREVLEVMRAGDPAEALARRAQPAWIAVRAGGEG